jgi:hypothetical protein
VGVGQVTPAPANMANSFKPTSTWKILAYGYAATANPADPTDPTDPGLVVIRGDWGNGPTEMPLTKAGLATQVHPTGDWVLLIKLDDMSIINTNDCPVDFNWPSDGVKSAQWFDAEATVKDVLECLAGLFVLGAFMGIPPVWRHPIGTRGRPVFEVDWRT